MATNTTILITVVAAVLLGLAGILAAVVYKTRTDGDRIGDQGGNNARHLEHQQAVADECAVQAHAAQVEVDVKSARARDLHRQASDAAAQLPKTCLLAG
jgi:predicted component of type VI protein secretion system